MSNTKHIALMTALSFAGIDDDTRHDLVSAWTNGRTSSTRELTGDEMTDLIWKLNNDHLFATRPRLAIEVLHESEMKRKRSIVLAIAQRTGLHTGTTFEKFNGWMVKSSILKKRLSKYTMDELDELIKQMHGLEANYKASAEKAGTKAWHHHYGLPESSPQ
jgi:hypothetical protein